ncbi:MAG: hypothetical protein SFX74_11290 [Fimbriimonadaceae bacterium]|nr:hypothetical protein [Fimbriimonadaceae bacterium]
MFVLAVPNWALWLSEAECAEVAHWLESYGVRVHDVSSDVDHGRTVTGFSGELGHVTTALDALAERLLPAIDLRRATGVHPRTGALDVVPFVCPDDSSALLEPVDRWAEAFAARWRIPMVRYAQSSPRGRSLPDIRRTRAARTDFGPSEPHPQWGQTVYGVRTFLIAANVNLATEDPAIAKAIAREIRTRREAGDPGWAGVRALGFPLPSRNLTQVSLNITEPDRVDLARIFESIQARAAAAGVDVAGGELVGVIRPQDVSGCAMLHPRPEQVVAEFGPVP